MNKAKVEYKVEDDLEVMGKDIRGLMKPTPDMCFTQAIFAPAMELAAVFSKGQADEFINTRKRPEQYDLIPVIH